MIKFAVFLLVLVAVVNSDEKANVLAGGDEDEGNFLAGGDEGEGNFLAGGDEGEGNFFAGGDEGEGNLLPDGDEGEGGFIADNADDDSFTVTRDVIVDPTTEDEIELPTRFTRVSLNVGSICSACRRLFSSDRRVNGMSGRVRVQQIRYSRAGIRIRSVRVNPIGTRAASITLQRGLGMNTAIITIRSRPSAGFAYRIQIHGQ